MSGKATNGKATGGLEPYSYSPHAELAESCSTWDLPRIDDNLTLNKESIEPTRCSVPVEDFAKRLAEEARRSFEAGRALGNDEGRATERALHLNAKQQRAGELQGALEGFVAERDRYLQAVETEVVRLACAIAARILRRETQTDPLLLMGAVRVALGQLVSATEVRLHVPAADAELWKEAVAYLPSSAVKPTVVAESSMSLGECRLEAKMGRSDLSLEAQLNEIEHLLFSASSGPVRSPAAAGSPS